MKSLTSWVPRGTACLLIVLALFGYLASVMGLSNMLNTIMHTAHDLLLNTCFYLMGICVVTGALGKAFVDFGVVDMIQKIMRPAMRPLFNLPGVASLGAVLTFLSDNPAIISLSKDKKFSRYFKKYQLISLTNFGTAFGMGLIVIVFMIGQGYFSAPFIGLVGAIVGCMISTRMMQYFITKDYPNYQYEDAISAAELASVADDSEAQVESGESTFIRVLNALLDGGKSGVEIGLAIIPGVLIISTLVMMFTFGGSAEGVDQSGKEIIVYTGGAYQGTQLLPYLAGKINFVFHWLFGFTAPELVAFPITALGAVGAALSLIPEFASKGIIDGNAIAVCTAMGMCWSGYLSTHTAMLDSLGYRQLLSRAFTSHFFGGIGAGIVAHWLFVGITYVSSLFMPQPVWNVQVDAQLCHSDTRTPVTLVALDDGSYSIPDWYGVKGTDLTFTVNVQDSTVHITNAYAEQNGAYFVQINPKALQDEISYATVYVDNQYAQFFGDEQSGNFYAFVYLYDGARRLKDGGYYELTWGDAEPQTLDVEESLKTEIAARVQADSIAEAAAQDTLSAE